MGRFGRENAWLPDGNGVGGNSRGMALFHLIQKCFVFWFNLNIICSSGSKSEKSEVGCFAYSPHLLFEKKKLAVWISYFCIVGKEDLAEYSLCIVVGRRRAVRQRCHVWVFFCSFKGFLVLCPQVQFLNKRKANVYLILPVHSTFMFIFHSFSLFNFC